MVSKVTNESAKRFMLAASPTRHSKDTMKEVILRQKGTEFFSIYEKYNPKI